MADTLAVRSLTRAWTVPMLSFLRCQSVKCGRNLSKQTTDLNPRVTRERHYSCQSVKGGGHVSFDHAHSRGTYNTSRPQNVWDRFTVAGLRQNYPGSLFNIKLLVVPYSFKAIFWHVKRCVCVVDTCFYCETFLVLVIFLKCLTAQTQVQHALSKSLS